jgi:hypothetical protein
VDFRVSDQPRDIGASFISSAALSMRHGQSRSAMGALGATRLSCAGCGTSPFLVAVFATRPEVRPRTPDKGRPTKNSQEVDSHGRIIHVH